MPKLIFAWFYYFLVIRDGSTKLRYLIISTKIQFEVKPWSIKGRRFEFLWISIHLNGYLRNITRYSLFLVVSPIVSVLVSLSRRWYWGTRVAKPVSNAGRWHTMRQTFQAKNMMEKWCPRKFTMKEANNLSSNMNFRLFHCSVRE